MHFLNRSACLVSSNWVLNFSALKDAFEIPIDNLNLSRRFESELRASCVSFSLSFFIVRPISTALRSFERACSTTDFSNVLRVDQSGFWENRPSWLFICPWTVSSRFVFMCTVSCISSVVWELGETASGWKLPSLRDWGWLTSEQGPFVFEQWDESFINLRVLKVLPNDFSKFLRKESNFSPKTYCHISIHHRLHLHHCRILTLEIRIWIRTYFNLKTR